MGACVLNESSRAEQGSEPFTTCGVKGSTQEPDQETGREPRAAQLVGVFLPGARNTLQLA